MDGAVLAVLMDGPIEWRDAGTVAGIVIAVGTLWLRLEAVFRDLRKDSDDKAEKVLKRVEDLERDLAEWKIEVGDKYARKGDMADVERRLMERLAEQGQQIAGVDRKIDRLLLVRVSGGKNG